MTEKPKRKYDDGLMRALDFKEADLELNRRGEMSKYQLERVRGSLAAIDAVMLILVVAGVLISLYVAQLYTILGFIAAIFCLIMGSLLFTYIETEWRGLARDRQAQKILQVEGYIHLDVTNAHSFKVVICDSEFCISKAMFLAFKNGEQYRIYYAPGTRKIFSAELIS
jgi:hypothetical protein